LLLSSQFSGGGVTWKSVQFSRDITNTHYAGNSQYSKFCRFRWTSKSLKAFSFRGASLPDPLTRGSAPGPRCGLRPQTPVIGSRSRARRGPPLPNCFRRPCLVAASYVPPAAYRCYSSIEVPCSRAFGT